MKLEVQAITDMMIQEAKESAEQMIRNAQELSKSILQKEKQLANDKAGQKAGLLLKKAANEAETERLRKLTNEETTANWIILSRKAKIIDSVLKTAKDRLRTMAGTRKYQSILERLIVDAGIVVGGGELEVLLNEKDSISAIDFDKLVKEISESTGIESKLTLSKDRVGVLGGALVRKSGCKVVMDNSFDDIFLRKNKKLRSETAKVLFQETAPN